MMRFLRLIWLPKVLPILTRRLIISCDVWVAWHLVHVGHCLGSWGPHLAILAISAIEVAAHSA